MCHQKMPTRRGTLFHMSVGFLSDDKLRERRRAELTRMTDEQLIEHGKTIRRIIGKPNPNVPPPEG